MGWVNGELGLPASDYWTRSRSGRLTYRSELVCIACTLVGILTTELV